MKLKKFLSAFFYLLFFLLFAGQISLELNPKFIATAKERIAFMLIISCAAIIAAVYRCSGERIKAKRKKTVRACVYMLFCVYIFNLAVLLFFDRGMRLTQASDITRYLKLNVNFVPLRTIAKYYNAWRKNRIGLYYVVINLLGNFFAFAPFGFFLPVINKGFYKFHRFILTVSALIIFAEAAQFWFRIGSCDVDDFILNFSGAFLAFIIFRTKAARAFLSRHNII
ncbi:MAG: VanZ family protein [Bacillota bacterium]|nr:VanZ family protein [Bacillota bacterium]